MEMVYLYRHVKFKPKIILNLLLKNTRTGRLCKDRPPYDTRKQEQLVFRAITAFRCESGESDLTPMQEEVIVGARCGSSLYYKLTKIVYTLS